MTYENWPSFSFLFAFCARLARGICGGTTYERITTTPTPQSWDFISRWPNITSSGGKWSSSVPLVFSKCIGKAVRWVFVNCTYFHQLTFLDFRYEYESPISTLVWFRVRKTLIKLWLVVVEIFYQKNPTKKSPKLLRPRGQKVTARCQWNNWHLMSCPEVIIQQLTRLWMHYYYYWPF